MKNGSEEPSEYEGDASTSLLESYNQGSTCGNKRCNHGTFSPRPKPHREVKSYDSQSNLRNRQEYIVEGTASDNGSPQGGTDGAAVVGAVRGRTSAKKISTTQWLAKRHGVKDTRLMYVVLDLVITSMLFMMPASDVAALITIVSLSGIFPTMSLS